MAEKKDEQEWRDKLTTEQYAVLRERQTEAPFSGRLNREKRGGLYKCAACGAELFSSAAKFESGSGWPSFTIPVEETAVETERDQSLGRERVEVHCERCGGHLGHLFEDGPQPSGQRYCINSLALEFIPNPAETGQKSPDKKLNKD